MIDWGQLASQMRALAGGDETSWPSVQQALHPELLRLARRQPIGRLRDDRDATLDVVVRVLERIRAHEFRALKRLFESETEPVIQAWIRVLVRSAAIDVMRQHAEFQRASAQRSAGWVSLVSLVSSPGSPMPDSLLEKQRDLQRYLERALAEAQATGDAAVLAARWQVQPVQARRLLQKGPSYLPVLRLVLAGQSYPVIATELAMTRREVELIVSYIEEFLQARGFAAPP